LAGVGFGFAEGGEAAELLLFFSACSLNFIVGEVVSGMQLVLGETVA